LRLWRAGELSLVRVPSPAEESFRDLVRAREDARGDLMRHRHRLSKFLLRRELRPPAGMPGAWSVPWMNWVRRLGFDDAAARATHVDYLAAVEAALQRRSALDLALEEAWPQSPFQTTIARLRCFRGIDTLSACGVAAEVGGFDRFERPDRLAGFLGIVASEHSSGGARRQGAITKAGSGPRPAIARRGRPPLPPPAPGQLRARPPPARPGPARGQCRLARPAAPSPPLAPPRTRAAQAGRRERRRARPRARLLLLGGRPGRLNTPTASARHPALPGRSPTQTQDQAPSHHRGPRHPYGQPADRRWRPLLDRGPRRITGHAVTSPRISG